MIKASSITVGKFPLPPSSNNQYTPLVIGGKARVVPSRDLKKFKKAMTNWHLAHARLAREARMFIMEVFARKNHVRMDTYLALPRDHIYWQNGGVKKSDMFNHLKALHDSFCEIITVDDSHIFAGYTERVGTTLEEPYCFLVLSEHRFRMVSQVMHGELPK